MFSRSMMRLILFLSLSSGPTHAIAAKIQAIDLPNQAGPGILISGTITQGDETTFHTLAATLPRAIVVVMGPGGRVGPALAIGSETHARGWSTLVPAGATCASACSMIWLAGERRMLAANAQIGFHAMSMLQDGRYQETHDADNVLRNWLTDLGFAMDATATIVNTHAASIRWFDAIELRANGIETESFP
jgi:hypothetical protein